MLKIRLARKGAKKRPFYDVVVTDSRKPRDSGYVERLGFYDPRMKESSEGAMRLDTERVDHWISIGAKMTPTAQKIFSVCSKAQGAQVSVPEAQEETEAEVPPQKEVE